MIRQNIAQLSRDISLICQKLGREREAITVVAATKYASREGLKDVIGAGIAHVAENRVQEAREKYHGLKAEYPGVTCHMIGHLQTNKVKDALGVFDIIQTVDSIRLVEEIEKQAARINISAEILLQVNTAKEPQKSGISEEEFSPLIEKAAGCKHIKVSGLMAIAPLTDNKEIIRHCFRRLRELKESAAQKFLGSKNIDLKFLSMGMSSDYPIALEEGANMLRIGSAIFK